MVQPMIGVIGGSGLYAMEGMVAGESLEMSTPFGDPSSPVMTGTLQGVPIAFLARHGLNHQYSPTEVNYRANIFALKELGVERVVAVSACGSLREDFAPGHIVVPDQLYDNTRRRPSSFFEEGMVAHVSVASPFCTDLSESLYQHVQKVGGEVHQGGAFITIEGPRFSTRVESNTFRAWGMSIIGMTTSPEAYLAREAEMCYSVMAHVTDYDVWHVSEEPVSVEMVIKVLSNNTSLAKKAIRSLTESIEPVRSCDCGHALEDALITPIHAVPQETREKLLPLVKKYLD